MDERTRRIWAGLVSYANAAVIDLDGFRRTVMDCMPWVAVGDPLSLFNWMQPSEQAPQYQSSVRALLRSLCSNLKSEEKDSAGRQGLHFIHEHIGHIEVRLMEVSLSLSAKERFKGLNYTSAELESFEEQCNRYWAGYKEGDSPFGIYIPSKEYQDLADPICDFILSEYQKYRSREYNRRDKKPAPWAPIFVCPNCNKLVIAERVGRKKYCSDCSDRARAEEYRQRASPDEDRDYQWLYRLRSLESDVRKIRLRNPNVRKRLSEIKARQQNSSRCQNLILKMRL
jgi:hypothetical protein